MIPKHLWIIYKYFLNNTIKYNKNIIKMNTIVIDFKVLNSKYDKSNYKNYLIGILSHWVWGENSQNFFIESRKILS